MRINVFGDTISAMVCAGCLAETGNHVTLIGERFADEAEPGLSKLLDSQMSCKRLDISNEFDREAEMHILSLGPDDCSKGKSIAGELELHADKNSTLVIRSNFSIGIVDQIAEIINLDYAINPDFASDGHQIQNFTRPDRIIIGTKSDKIKQQLRVLYAPFNRNKDVIIEMSPASAELTKYATNAMLATRISMMNELASISEKTGADIDEVRIGLGADKRIGRSYLYSGIGFGGYHFTRDLERIQKLLPSSTENGGQSLLQSVIEINNNQKELFFRKLWQYYNCELQGKTITLWGLGYKPNTTSVEGAASIALINAFVHQGCKLQLHDPFAMQETKKWVEKHLTSREQSNISFHEEMYEATQGSDALCVLTEYKAFWSPDFERLAAKMTSNIILDGRNLYNKFWVEENGFTYFGVGR